MINLKNGLFTSETLLKELKALSSCFAIITDNNLKPLYGKPLQERLGVNSHIFSFPAGEAFKIRKTKEKLEDALFDKGLGKETCLIGIGGGVVTDLAGYLASTYCRGIPLVFIPTTLMGMVDACMGGKNGVNLPQGKNMIGTCYSPSKIFIDPLLLSTLSLRELRNGAVEMIKHGVIVDSLYFETLKAHPEKLFNQDPSYLEKMIAESCRIKTGIISQDTKETGLRHLLNFGHTLGHALEISTHYTLSHGEAVALGMIGEGHLSVQTGHLTDLEFTRIQDILHAYGLPLSLPAPIDIPLFLQLLKRDKKTSGGRPRFVLLEKIGKAASFGGAYCTPVDESVLQNTLKWMNHALRTH